MNIFPKCINNLIGSYLLPYDYHYEIRNFRDVLSEIKKVDYYIECKYGFSRPPNFKVSNCLKFIQHVVQKDYPEIVDYYRYDGYYDFWLTDRIELPSDLPDIPYTTAYIHFPIMYDYWYRKKITIENGVDFVSKIIDIGFESHKLLECKPWGAIRLYKNSRHIMFVGNEVFVSLDT